MVRVNVGISPGILMDEHLIAENVELQMLLKFIEKHPTGYIPEKFTLGKGHMSFFRNKAHYIIKKLIDVQQEMNKRKINVNKNWYEIMNNLKIPDWNFEDYDPTDDDRKIVLKRIVERVQNPLRKRNPWSFYGRKYDGDYSQHPVVKYYLKGESYVGGYVSGYSLDKNKSNIGFNDFPILGVWQK